MENKTYSGAIKAASDKSRTLTHVITTKQVDRDGEVVIPRGIDVTNYRKNPVVFFNHRSHNDPPVGRNLDMQVSDDEVTAITQFAGVEQMHPQAEMLYRLYRDGFMKSWSVGFRVSKESPQPVMAGQTRRTILEWDLLEYSAVGIPANPGAVTRMIKSLGLPDGANDMDLAKAVGTVQPSKFWEVTKDIFDPELSNVVKHDAEEKMDSAVEDLVWRPGKVLAQWKDFCYDLEKNTTNMDLYKTMFAWRDGSNIELVDSYRLPHHALGETQLEGEVKVNLVQHWQGTQDAMETLLCKDSGIPEQDHQAVYAHLVEHFHTFGKEPPVFQKYTVEEWSTLKDYWNDEPSDSAVEVNEDGTIVPAEKADATTVQSVICAKSRFKSASEAGKWVRDHDYKAGEPDETETSYRYRQFEPGTCQDNSFRTINLTRGVSAVICRKKSAGKRQPVLVEANINIKQDEGDLIVEVEVEKNLMGYRECGFTNAVGGISSPVHVHDYRLNIKRNEQQMIFEGGWASAVADHSHRISMESLMKGETESSDGHSHKLMSSGETRAVLLQYFQSKAVADDLVEKEGRVLSSNNFAKLTRASEMLTEVLSSAIRPPKPDDSGSENMGGKSQELETDEELFGLLRAELTGQVSSMIGK